MEENKKQSSVYELVNLPIKRSLLSAEECIFDKGQIAKDELKYVNPKVKKCRDDLVDQLQEQFLVFDQTAYDFKFPISKFPDVPEGKRNNMTYEQKVEVEEEDTFANRLSHTQVQQIKERGEFQVRSKSEKATIPYVWKVNGCLFRGRVKRGIAWEEGLARIYSIMDFAVELVAQTVPYNLKKLVCLPAKFFALIFGRKKLKLFYSPDYQREVIKDFWTDIMENDLKDLNNQVGHQFLELLYLAYEPALYEEVDTSKKPEEVQELQTIRTAKIVKYNDNKARVDQLKQKLRGIQQKFHGNWAKIRKNVLSKVSTKFDQHVDKSVVMEHDEDPLTNESTNKKDQKILENFHEEKYLIYIAHVKQSLQKENFSKGVTEALLALITIISLIQSKMKIKETRLTETENNIRENIRKKHPIRSRVDKFVYKQTSKLFVPLKEQIEAEFYDRLMDDPEIRKHVPERYQEIYRKYVALKRDLSQRIAHKKQMMKCLFEPQRVFRTTYILFPPYEVVKINSYYSLKRKEELRTDTSTHFWKCALYAMRFKSWSINCFKFMVGMCWASPLGLRCLFGVKNFAYDQQCDANGFKSQITRPPFLGRFAKVLRGITKSRNAFEALPDRGLFGKNCSRICNYLECYVFRFFFVGIIGVIMLYPLAIILFSCLCFFGILTFWLWVPLCMVLCYLFNILIFQFEISYQPSGCLIRSVPLLSLVFLILVYILKIVGSILFLLVLAPIGCLFYFLYIIFQRVGRTISDTIMLCLIGCLGRTPSRDTSIAKKISGPGMSRNYFYSIAEQDVYILTQSALQQIVVNKYIELTRNEIQETSKKYNTLCNFVLRPFGYSRANINANKDHIIKNTNQLTNHFNRKIQNYMARYPNNPRNVRFTREEIQLYFENCVKIVKNFVEKQRIQDWVFEQRQILYEDYDQLTRSLWVSIFNCGEEIFQPIEKIDNRFQLIDENDQNYDGIRQNKGSIMKALQGQIELTHIKVNFSPARKSLLDKDTPISHLSTLTNLHDTNSSTYIACDLNNPCCLFVAPRNLREVKAFDGYNREKILRNRAKVIQEPIQFEDIIPGERF